MTECIQESFSFTAHFSRRVQSEFTAGRVSSDSGALLLMEALRRLGLKGTAWAEAQVDTIRLKLLKIGAIVRLSARRVLLQLSSAYPWKDIYAQTFHALRC